MATKGLSFVDWCVRALQNTRPDVWPAEPIDASKASKWQTRRLVKPQPEWREDEASLWPHGRCKGYWFRPDSGMAYGPTDEDCKYWLDKWQGRADSIPQPRYQPGDICYVKEGLRFDPRAHGAIYAADNERVWEPAHPEGSKLTRLPFLWRWQRDCLPSRYMPRAAARMWLKVMGVRAQQVQEITEADVLAEGIERVEREDPHLHRHFYKIPGEDCLGSYAYVYQECWDALNPKHPWESNPWVWVYDIMRTEEHDSRP